MLLDPVRIIKSSTLGNHVFFSDDLTLSLFFNENYENDKRYWPLIPQPFLHCPDVEQDKII